MPHQVIIIFNKAICATIIGTPRNSYEQDVTVAIFPFIFDFLKLIRVLTWER